MSDKHNEEHEHIGIPGYLGVFTILIVGTILTYFAATIDMDWIFPGANTLVALLIAFTKMTFVRNEKTIPAYIDCPLTNI